MIAEIIHIISIIRLKLLKGKNILQKNTFEHSLNFKIIKDQEENIYLAQLFTKIVWSQKGSAIVYPSEPISRIENLEKRIEENK